MISRLKSTIRTKLMERLTRSLSVYDVYQMISKQVDRQPPREALQYLFKLDALLYVLQSRTAGDYEGGIHPKHRLMNYHAFFVERIQAGERVLDIGCGNGALAFDVAQQANAHVTGMDLDESSVAYAKKHYQHTNTIFMQGDVLQDLPDEKFDIIILSNVLEHLPDRENFLEQIVQTASPRRLLIRVPLYEREWRVPLKKELNVEWRLDLTHETEYTQEGFANEIQAAGLEVVNQQIRWGEIWAEVKPQNA